MDEHFKKVEAGDPISARRDNKIAGVCERFGQAGIGSFLTAHHGASTFSISGRAPAPTFTMEITNAEINDDDDDDSGLYLGKIRCYGSSGDEWKNDDAQEYQIDARDTCPLLVVGDRVVCYWDGQRGMFIPIPNNLIRRFELKVALTSGGSTVAYLLYWDEDASDYSTDTSTEDEDDPGNPEVEFTVWDARGDLNGKAKGDDCQGSRGYAKWCMDSQRWEIVSIQQYGKIKALTKGAVLAADGTYTVDNVTVMRGISPLDDPTSVTETMTIQNTFKDKLDDAAVITSSHNNTTGLWETDDITCPV